MSSRRKAGPCLMGQRNDKWDARAQRFQPRVKFPRGCAGFRCWTKSGICQSCNRKWGS